MVPLVLAGVTSVILWRRSEELGAGDIRFYIFVQAFPMLALLMFFPPRYTRSNALWLTIILYGVAKAFELFDLRFGKCSGTPSAASGGRGGDICRARYARASRSSTWTYIKIAGKHRITTERTHRGRRDRDSISTHRPNPFGRLGS